MNCLLKLHVGASTVPYGSSACFATFAHQNVTGTQTEAVQFAAFKQHVLQTRRINVKPAHVRIA